LWSSFNGNFKWQWKVNHSLINFSIQKKLLVMKIISILNKDTYCQSKWLSLQIDVNCIFLKNKFSIYLVKTTKKLVLDMKCIKFIFSADKRKVLWYNFQSKNIDSLILFIFNRSKDTWYSSFDVCNLSS
jgi:hypothetical protein